MDGFFTKAFLNSLPEQLNKPRYSERNTYDDLFDAIEDNRLRGIIDESILLNFLESLNEMDSGLYNYLQGLEAGGKLRGTQIDQSLPDFLSNLIIKKSVIKQVCGAYHLSSDFILHQDFENVNWKDQLVIAGNKPVIENKDLVEEKFKYLFTEKSIPLNKGDEFNWSRFLKDFVLPFQNIRILDPYLYINVSDIKLSNILQTLIRQSSEHINIEIISDLSASNKFKEKELFHRVISELKPIKQNVSISLLTQKGSASDIFHKRAIWTDYWMLWTDRGVDFLELEIGKGKVKRENVMLLTGKYSSKNSAWTQLKDNWSNYIKASKEL